MNIRLLELLKGWRVREARRRGVELYRVLPNRSLAVIAEREPSSEAQLLDVPGIGPKKLERYGTQLLALVAEAGGGVAHVGDTGAGDDEVREVVPDDTTGSAGDMEGNRAGFSHREHERVFGVSDFLDLLNIGLRRSEAKVRGEVSSVSVKGGHCYFSLQDERGAVLNALMWRDRYERFGVQLAVGMEVIVGGYPEIYKPSGRLTFMAQTVELVGEGALKAAYDALYRKLATEGMFDEVRKKRIPDFPERIALITSQTGAVIHDFLNNIGKHGYRIEFYDSRVEGVEAVDDLLAGIRYFSKHADRYDVLVIIRGGGSLESLQAFNNEALVRAVAACPIPTLAGIGHDKDVSLVALAADRAVSTPTATTRVLNASWEEGAARRAIVEQLILSRFSRMLDSVGLRINEGGELVAALLRRISHRVHGAEVVMHTIIRSFSEWLVEVSGRRVAARRVVRAYELHSRQTCERVGILGERISGGMRERMADIRKRLDMAQRIIAGFNPRSILRLGYAIVRTNGLVVRSVSDVRAGDMLSTTVSDGAIISKVTESKKDNE